MAAGNGSFLQFQFSSTLFPPLWMILVIEERDVTEGGDWEVPLVLGFSISGKPVSLGEVRTGRCVSPSIGYARWAMAISDAATSGFRCH